MNISLDQFEGNLLERAVEHKVAKGAHWVQAGAPVHQLAYLKSGYLRTYQIDYKGQDVTVEFHGPKQFCSSYYGFYTDEPALDSIVAMTDCELLLISYETLMELYAQHPELNRLGRLLIEQVCIRKDLRIAKMLQSDGKGRYEWFLETAPEVAKVAPLKHIASYLGLQPETLSRIRRRMLS